MLGACTIAVGSPHYYRMAFVNAATFKKYNPKIPIVLITDTTGIVGIYKEDIKVFDDVIRIKPESYEISGRPEPQTIKFQLAELTPFEETIFTDADTINFGSIDKTLVKLSNRDLTFMQHGYYDFSTGSRNAKCGFWGNIEEIKKYYNITTGKLPAISSTFIHFKKTQLNKTIFQEAADLFSKDAPCHKWAETLPDEFFFNVALHLNNYDTHWVQFYPVFSHWFCTEGTELEIKAKYPMLTTGGNKVPKFVKGIYDREVAKITTHYPSRFYHRDKKDILTERTLI